MQTMSPYTVRHFQQSPDSDQASDLLAKICDETFYAEVRPIDRPLALYGAGDLGRMAFSYFKFLNMPVALVVDANAHELQNQAFWAGVCLATPNEIPVASRSNYLLAVCIVNYPYAELASTLRGVGWGEVLPFYDITAAYGNRHPLANGWYAEAFTKSDFIRIASVLRRWSDDMSRAHHLQFIAWRRLRAEWQFANAPVHSNNRFFIPELINTLHDRESFADLGAHNGSVSLKFTETVDHQFQHIWAIEPDPINRSLLQQQLEPHAKANKISILSTILGSETSRQGFFSGLGYSSQISDLSSDIHDIHSLDSLNLRPTIIKLHLEGMELAVLKGALCTLQNCRPIIAATVYHNTQGLWVIQDWLMHQLDNYQFYMRLHSWCGTGAVVYCIPTERQTDSKCHALQNRTGEDRP